MRKWGKELRDISKTLLSSLVKLAFVRRRGEPIIGERCKRRVGRLSSESLVELIVVRQIGCIGEQAR